MNVRTQTALLMLLGAFAGYGLVTAIEDMGQRIHPHLTMCLEP